MSKLVRWRGQWYLRQSGKDAPNWRNRNSGVIIKKAPKVIVRKGQRNRVIVRNGKNYVGVEETGKHFFFSDPKQSKTALRKFQVRVKSNRKGSKKSRSSHTRRLR